MSRSAHPVSTTFALVAAASLGTVLACSSDGGRVPFVTPPPPACTLGALACDPSGKLTRCEASASADGGVATVVYDDCAATGRICSATLRACAACEPGSGTCADDVPSLCRADGSGFDVGEACDTTAGVACRGGRCTNLCAEASRTRSNVGCEYWAVDLDNARIDAALNAAAQQFAVVVSNTESGVTALVTVEVDDAPPGAPPQLRTVGRARVLPNSLEVFRLGPREVDGSPEGEFDTGTGTALTRHAFRVRSTVPIVAYQFNPLENANVFSNDASLLLPTPALVAAGLSYVVAGWPQTIARTDDPATNFDRDLRAFLTVVGTQNGTRVKVVPATDVIPGGPVAARLAKGTPIEVTLDAFDVLNLESGGFNADFTGSTVEASGPVAVFSGSEASDAPAFNSLGERSCCADHLEEQASPLRTLGQRFVSVRSPNRTRALQAAGASVGTFVEPEFVRVVASAEGSTTVRTTLAGDDASFVLAARGESRTIRATRDFAIAASAPVVVANVQGSQEAAGVARGLPGGDPSLLFVSPFEQWRSDYVFLTPDKYSFDFIVVAAEAAAQVYLDGVKLGPESCEITPFRGLPTGTEPAPDLVSYRCQLSFPVIDPSKPAPQNLLPGRQNDGVHRLQSTRTVSLAVYGFDAFVSYAYLGGTQLKELVIQ
jgi:hypothetical protein